jgi:hypothetical protein
MEGLGLGQTGALTNCYQCQLSTLPSKLYLTPLSYPSPLLDFVYRE